MSNYTTNLTLKSVLPSIDPRDLCMYGNVLFFLFCQFPDGAMSIPRQTQADFARLATLFQGTF
jgi:hypothetical protein